MSFFVRNKTSKDIVSAEASVKKEPVDVSVDIKVVRLGFSTL